MTIGLLQAQARMLTRDESPLRIHAVRMLTLAEADAVGLTVDASGAVTTATEVAAIVKLEIEQALATEVWSEVYRLRCAPGTLKLTWTHVTLDDTSDAGEREDTQP